MAKLNVPKVFDFGLVGNTKSGQELKPFFDHFNLFSEQVIRALINALTFLDNFDCLISTVSLTHGQDAIINSNGRQPIGLIPLKVVASSLQKVDSFGWTISSAGRVTVNASFVGSPTTAQNVVLLMIFG